MAPARTLLLIVALSAISVPQARPQVPREWLQSSAAEFLAGSFHQTIVTNKTGGEVQLQYPLYRSGADSLLTGPGDRFIGLDGSGNFVRAWQDHDSIVVRRFDAAGNPASAVLRVSEPGRGLIYNVGYVPSALLDNGFFYVAWVSSDSGKVYGQLFSPGGAKIGPNRFITTSGHTQLFSNNVDSTFRVITINRTPAGSDTTAILCWRIDLSGEQADPAPKRLHHRISPLGILSATARMDRAGEFILAWIASGWIYGGTRETLFVQRFDNVGDPLRAPVIVNDFLGWGVSFPYLALDDSGRYLVVWADNRNDQPGGSQFDIYAQLYDDDDTPILANFRVNTTVGPGNTWDWWPDVHFRNGHYRVSWTTWNEPALRYDVYSNTWSYFFDRAGEYTSPVYDAGPLLVDYDRLFRTAPLPAGTSLGFRLRSAQSLPELDAAEWTGPGNSPDSFYAASGALIGPGHASHRMVQYRAYFASSQWGVSPSLRDVRLTYRIDSVAPPDPPSTVSLLPAHGAIVVEWQSSPSPAIGHYRIHRGTAPHAYDAGWTKTVPGTTHSFTDTSITIGVTYHYAVTAVDSNLQESAYTDDVSGRSAILTLYVSAEAADGGIGSFEFPFRSIQDATAEALDHDTVFVLPGTYDGMVRIPPRVSLIGSGARFTTIAAGGDSNVIRCGLQSTLRGFTIRQTGPVKQWCAVWCGNSGPTIEDNVIINMVPESNPNDFQGIFANGGLPTIRRNYIVDFESGIDISDDVTSVINNNIVISRLVGIQLFNHAVATITNNTVVIIRPYGSGFWAFPNPSANIRNNIFAGISAGNGMAFNTSCYLPLMTHTVEYNDAWNFLTTYECVPPGPGNISADPLFVGGAAGDYRLESGSPCRNAGDPGAPYLDADGSRNDLGAFGGPDPITPGMFSGFDVVFGIGSTSGFPGDTVRVDLSIENGTSLASAGFTLDFDASLAGLLSVERTPATDSMLVEVDTIDDGTISVRLVGGPPQGGGSVRLLSLVFRIDPSAGPDQATSLLLTGVSLQDEDDVELVLRGLDHGAIIVSPGGEGGRYLFVDRRSGSATADGTRLHPWKTIGEAVARATPGDTVLIAAGTYEEVISVPDSIHIRGSGAAITTLRADTASAMDLEPVVRFSFSHGSSISGMSITDATTELPPATGPIDGNASSFEIFNCLIASKRPPITALLFLRGKSSASIHDNVFHGGSGPAALIEIWDSSDARIHRNHFGQTDRAVGINHSRGTIGNNRFNTTGSGDAQIEINTGLPVVVHNNLIASFNDNSIVAIRADSTRIVNNTLVGGFTGIEVRNSSPPVMNNIVTGHQYGILLDGGPPSTYNNSWGNANDYYNTVPGEGDISDDPLFIDPPGRDYRLATASSSRDAGNPDPLYDDLDGTRNDMGAFGGPGLDTTFFTPGGATLRIGESSGPPGDTLRIPIVGSLLRGTASAELTIGYDPLRLSLVNARTTPGTAMFSLRLSGPAPGIIGLRLTSPRGLRVDSATIATLEFVPMVNQLSTTLRFKDARLLRETSSEIPVSTLLDGQIVLTAVRDDWALPTSIELEQNYPNPFNPVTTVRYRLPVRSRVTLRLYDLLGREIRTLVDEIQEAGNRTIDWNSLNGRGIPASSGVYVYRLEVSTLDGPSASVTRVRKMILLR